MNQYKVSLHDCSKGTNPTDVYISHYKFRTVFWRDKTAISIGKLVRKRITTKTVLGVFKFWDAIPKEMISESPDWKEYLKRTQIKEYETV